ncbi:retrovirus-related pol polyprotein from transposon TNT 1-94 [Tanacetum coccineum]
MDLCGPMRIQSINGRRYILVIVDDYSWFTWVKLLRSKDEVLTFVIKFLKMIQIHLNTIVCNIRTDNGTEFANQTLQAVATKPDLSYLHVFGALCYPTNDGEDLGKLRPKADIEIFVGYAPAKKAFRIYNKRTRMIMETIHVNFDELTAMASEQFSSGLRPKLMTPRIISSGLVQNIPSSTPNVPPTKNDWETLTKSKESSTQIIIPDNVHSLSQPLEHINKWTKDHPIDNVIGDPSRPVSTLHQLQDEALFCYFDAFLSSIEPKSYKDALTYSSWIEAMQEELNEF